MITGTSANKSPASPGGHNIEQPNPTTPQMPGSPIPNFGAQIQKNSSVAPLKHKHSHEFLH